MSTVRTQVYLTDEQRRLIDRMARSRGVTMAEVVRSALDAYLVDEPDPSAVLAETFGVAPGAEVPPRREWDRG